MILVKKSFAVVYLAYFGTKDEFKIEPRYAHKKYLNKSEKNSYVGNGSSFKALFE